MLDETAATANTADDPPKRRSAKRGPGKNETTQGAAPKRSRKKKATAATGTDDIAWEAVEAADDAGGLGDAAAQNDDFDIDLTDLSAPQAGAEGGEAGDSMALNIATEMAQEPPKVESRPVASSSKKKAGVQSKYFKLPKLPEATAGDQDGTIPQLIKHVTNRKKSASRGHQLPPEERKKEREKDKQRTAQEKANAEKEKKAKKEEKEKEDEGPEVEIALEEDDAVASAALQIEPIARVGSADGAGEEVLEIEMEEEAAAKKGNKGAKRKGTRLSKAERELYLEAHKVHLLAAVAHVQQIGRAANSEALQAALLSLLPADEFPKKERDTTELLVDVSLLSSLSLWLTRKFLTNITGGEEEVEDQKSAAGTPKKKSGKRKKKGDEEDEEDDDGADFEKTPRSGKKEKKKSSPTKAQPNAADPATLPAWSAGFWEKRLLEVVESRQASAREATMLWVALCRALGLDARFVLSLAVSPFSRTKEYSLSPEKDKGSDPLPAYGNDLALDLAWAEVYSPQMHKWVHADPVTRTVNKPAAVESSLNASRLTSSRGSRYSSLSYVIAVDTAGRVRDVTRRYAVKYSSLACLQRLPDTEWWESTLAALPPPTVTEAQRLREEEEEAELEKLVTRDADFPTTQDAYKKHPLYVLEKFVGKFDVIWPKDKVLGHFNDEPIYPRSTLHHLHTQDGWLKEGREVRIGEVPLKRVPKRRRRQKEGAERLPDMDTELFGRWQTEVFVPPVAHDGVVPKNSHGNVYLYKEWMLPKGCVHVQLPQIARTCRYLGVDYAQAHVDWEPRGGLNIPVFDGVVICEEYYPAVREAWEEHYSRQQAKEFLERKKKVVGHWRRFARALLIRDRLRRSYSDGIREQEEMEKEEAKKKTFEQRWAARHTAKHVHVYPPEKHAEEEGRWWKVCACGHRLEFEPI